MWYYLSMPSVWFSELPESVQNDILADKDGPYASFPHYSTASPSQMSLNASQSNLLSNMVAWTLLQHEDMVSDIILGDSSA